MVLLNRSVIYVLCCTMLTATSTLSIFCQEKSFIKVENSKHLIRLKPTLVQHPKKLPKELKDSLFNQISILRKYTELNGWDLDNSILTNRQNDSDNSVTIVQSLVFKGIPQFEYNGVKKSDKVDNPLKIGADKIEPSFIIGAREKAINPDISVKYNIFGGFNANFKTDHIISSTEGKNVLEIISTLSQMEDSFQTSNCDIDRKTMAIEFFQFLKKEYEFFLSDSKQIQYLEPEFLSLNELNAFTLWALDSISASDSMVFNLEINSEPVNATVFYKRSGDQDYIKSPNLTNTILTNLPFAKWKIKAVYNEKEDEKPFDPYTMKKKELVFKFTPEKK